MTTTQDRPNLTVVRERAPEPHQCLCVMVGTRRVREVYVTPGMGAMVTETEEQVHNDCKAVVDNPDQPVCDVCTESGHFDNPSRVPFDQVIEHRRGHCG